ncbi:MAG: gluconate 2-dehydrogenase subunit 3 family protein, partial [Pseudomonadales bacterium]|nr:gluconate 2-dehydrogenase subunit 3 family protein [Pseudomonadales bacterium]
MNRRELLQMIASATAWPMIGSTVLLTACNSTAASRSASFSAEDETLLGDMAETIMPRTETPGAKDADVAPFMMKIVDDCYDDADQARFHAGLNTVREECQRRYAQSFAELSQEQRNAFLVGLDREARAYQLSEGGSAHYFTMIKQLTLFAYFTSE